MKDFVKKNGSIIIVGLVIGVIASLLQFFGNPGNMGFCVACFARDTAGALGLHSLTGLSYIRPEIIGIMLGSLIAAIIFKEFKPRGGTGTPIKFFLGVFASIGALVFLGCPWRAALRLAGGDLNGITGLLGLITGIFIASRFIKKGYTLGKAQETNKKATGFIFPGFMIAILLLSIFGFSKLQSGTAAHAPLFLGLGLAMIVGFLAQRVRFCTVGAFRNIIMVKDFHLFFGIFAFILGALILNLLLGQFKLGFTDQPIAHNNHLWNFLGMVLSGLCFTLGGGCPGRQLVLAGEGDSDGGIFFVGLLVGAAFAHNFGLASSPAGIGQFGAIGTILGIAFTLIVGFSMIAKRK